MKGKPGRRACKNCGVERDVADFPRPRRGKAAHSTVCRVCWNRARWRRADWKRRGRRCPRCHELRSCPSEIGTGNTAICVDCKRKTMREYRRESRKDPATRALHNATTRRWRRNHPDKAAASQRNYRARLMEDPERAQEWREYQRIYHRIWRERKGVVPRPLSEQRYRNGNGRTFYSDGYGHLPADRLVPFIEDYLHADLTLADSKRQASRRELGRLSGLSDRRIYAILNGEWPNVRRDTADKICTALGVPLTLVYPEDVAV